MRHEAYNNDSISDPSNYYPPDKYSAPDLYYWDTTRYTDWQKELIGGTARYTNLSLGLTGGNTLIKYLLRGTYYKETTVFPGDFSDTKGSMHFNFSSSSANKKFGIELTANYLFDDNNLFGRDFTRDASCHAA